MQVATTTSASAPSAATQNQASLAKAAQQFKRVFQVRAVQRNRLAHCINFALLAF